MSRVNPPRDLIGAGSEFLGSARFINALTVCAIGTSVLATAVRHLIGLPGLVGVVVVLVLLAGMSLLARRDSLQWQSLLPISLLVFLGWAGISILWSQYQWATLWGLAYLFAFSLLGLYVALVRDTIQIVRAFGDVLRFVLVASLSVEIISGLLIDTPLRFLGVQGNLAELGPIQGLLDTRNQLALVALIALITFATELRTRSIGRWIGAGSLAVALLTLALSRSPVMGGIFVVAALATGALLAIRLVPAAQRTVWQLVLLGGVVITAAIAWSFRAGAITLFNAGGDLDYRLNLWQRIWDLVAVHPLEGWGWIGYWQTGIAPFTTFATSTGREPNSALNSFVDIWLQLGLVGTALFAGLVGLAFVRSWLLAGRRRSIVFAWPAIILVVLILSSLAESSTLVEYGWLTFVVCTVKAARELSWRRAFARSGDDTDVDEAAI